MPVEGIQGDAPANAAATLVVRNARIYTQDPQRPACSAIAIRGERIVAVGSDRDMGPHVGKDTRIVDAVGRRVIPGLNDAHLHAIRGGLHYLLELRWDGVASLRTGLAIREDPARGSPSANTDG